VCAGQRVEDPLIGWRAPKAGWCAVQAALEPEVIALLSARFNIATVNPDGR
jgi:hypothetical protein